MGKPKVVCICASSRFHEDVFNMEWALTHQGYVVLSFATHDEDLWKNLNNETLHRIRRAHLHKIELAHEVLVMNINGYIGETVQRELAYAIYLNKEIEFYEVKLGNAYLRTYENEISKIVASFHFQV